MNWYSGWTSTYMLYFPIEAMDRLKAWNENPLNRTFFTFTCILSRLGGNLNFKKCQLFERYKVKNLVLSFTKTYCFGFKQGCTEHATLSPMKFHSYAVKCKWFMFWRTCTFCADYVFLIHKESHLWFWLNIGKVSCLAWMERVLQYFTQVQVTLLV